MLNHSFLLVSLALIAYINLFLLLLKTLWQFDAALLFQPGHPFSWRVGPSRLLLDQELKTMYLVFENGNDVAGK